VEDSLQKFVEKYKAQQLQAVFLQNFSFVHQQVFLVLLELSFLVVLA